MTFAPSARSRIACISRSCCRHLPKVMLRSSWKSLSTVLLLAPPTLHICESGRRSLGSAKRTAATRRALGSDGLGSCEGTTLIASNWSMITPINRPCDLFVFRKPVKVQAFKISSLNNGDTFTTQHSLGKVFASLVLKYRVRIATVPDIVMVCGTAAGIQTARWVGTTHVPSSVRTVITPREAYTSWSRS